MTDKTMTLEPCPFCGNAPFCDKLNFGSMVKIGCAPCSFYMYGKWSKILPKWNSRAIHLSQPAERVRVPDGWKLVPVDPTPDMIIAGIKANLEHAGKGVFGSIYKAMLFAAPEANPSPTIDVAAVREVIAWIRNDAIGYAGERHMAADKLASAIGDEK